MSRQVRLDDDVADWLAGTGLSLSAAANQALRWARDEIEAADTQPTTANGAVRSGRARTASSAARSRSFAAAARRL